jgi:hypothetical protein
MVSITISGTLSQVTSGLATLHRRLRGRRNYSERAVKNSEIARRREIVYCAWKVIRNDPEHQDSARRFVSALAGPPPIAAEIVSEAQKFVIVPRAG